MSSYTSEGSSIAGVIGALVYSGAHTAAGFGKLIVAGIFTGLGAMAFGFGGYVIGSIMERIADKAGKEPGGMDGAARYCGIAGVLIGSFWGYHKGEQWLTQNHTFLGYPITETFNQRALPADQKTLTLDATVIAQYRLRPALSAPRLA